MVKCLVADSVEWAQLEDCHSTTVGDFIDSLPAQNTLSPEKQTYLFDWSLPIHCPALAQELTIPKYFAGTVTIPKYLAGADAISK